ncbi:MAG TPA: hypothetical protein VJ859_13785 [Allosphingosinicella sp.]|nr:hypothetical protein [Allosphingosinicella sp.]
MNVIDFEPRLTAAKQRRQGDASRPASDPAVHLIEAQLRLAMIPALLGHMLCDEWDRYWSAMLGIGPAESRPDLRFDSR